MEPDEIPVGILVSKLDLVTAQNLILSYHFCRPGHLASAGFDTKNLIGGVSWNRRKFCRITPVTVTSCSISLWFCSSLLFLVIDSYFLKLAEKLLNCLEV